MEARQCEYKPWPLGNSHSAVIVHVAMPGAKNCVCGLSRNPSYRTWWQRFKDHREFKKVQRRR